MPLTSSLVWSSYANCCASTSKIDKHVRYDARSLLFLFKRLQKPLSNCEGFVGFLLAESYCFFPALYSPCSVCRGQRYNDKDLLEITLSEINKYRWSPRLNRWNICTRFFLQMSLQISRCIRPRCCKLGLGYPCEPRTNLQQNCHGPAKPNGIKLEPNYRRTQTGDYAVVSRWTNKSGFAPSWRKSMLIAQFKCTRLMQANHRHNGRNTISSFASSTIWVIDIRPRGWW